MFDGSVVDAAGEGDWPSGFGSMQVEPSTVGGEPVTGAQDAQGTPPTPADSASALRRFNIFADRVKKPWTPPLLLLPVSELPVEDTTYGLPPRSAEQNWLGWWLIPALLVAGSSGW